MSCRHPPTQEGIKLAERVKDRPGKPGVLQFHGVTKSGHHLATEKQQGSVLGMGVSRGPERALHMHRDEQVQGGNKC